MAIIVRLDVMLALRKARSKDLAQHVGITETNLSLAQIRPGEGHTLRDARRDLHLSGLPAGGFAGA